MWCLFFCNLLAILPYVEACVVEQLTPPTSDLDVSGSSLAHHAVSLDKEYYATCLSSARCITGYQQYTAVG